MNRWLLQWLFFENNGSHLLYILVLKYVCMYVAMYDVCLVITAKPSDQRGQNLTCGLQATG